MADVPDVAGVLSAQQCVDTASSIARTQHSSGAIPWSTFGHTDPWDHVESAMAPDRRGPDRARRAAFEWSRRTQRADGSWPIQFRGDVIEDANADSNFCAYIAAGVWHHFQVTGDHSFAERMRADGAGRHRLRPRTQPPGGEIGWARSSSVCSRKRC